MKIEKVALIGFGYWGKKLARVFHQLGVLDTIVDQSNDVREQAKKDYPDIEEVTKDAVNLSVDAVAIATPPKTHYELALRCMEMGKHVFVEKPLALNYRNARTLEDVARERNLRLNVGHIYLFNPGLMAIPKPDPPFELRIRFLNDKGSPSESTKNLFYAALPHAASIMYHFLPEATKITKFEAIKAENELWISMECNDSSFIFIDIGDFTGVKARTVQIGWAPYTYVFDAATPGQYEKYRPDGRTVLLDELIPVSQVEPLLAECKAFIEGTKANDNAGSMVAKFIDYVVLTCSQSPFALLR